MTEYESDIYDDDDEQWDESSLPISNAKPPVKKFSLFKRIFNYLNSNQIQETPKKITTDDIERHAKFVQEIKEEELKKKEQESNNMIQKLNEDYEKQELSKKVDLLIQSNILPLVLEMQKSGYELTGKQKTAFRDQINVILLEGKTEVLDQLMQYGYKLDDASIIDLILLSKNNKLITYINEKFDGKWKETDFVKSLQKSWIYYLTAIKEDVDVKVKQAYSHKQGHDALTVINDMQNQKEHYVILIKKITNDYFTKIESQINLDSYLQVIALTHKLKETYTKFEDNLVNVKDEFDDLLTYYDELEDGFSNEHLNDVVEKMTAQVNKGFRNDKEDLLEKVKTINIDSFLKNKVIENAAVKVKESSDSDLPKEAKEIIDEIKMQITSLMEQSNKIPEEYAGTIQKLWEKRLPDVLETYLSLTPEYRETLVNVNNKTPKELMVEALSDINATLKTVILNINQQKVDSLSVLQRYTSEIKQNVNKMM